MVEGDNDLYVIVYVRAFFHGGFIPATERSIVVRDVAQEGGVRRSNARRSVLLDDQLALSQWSILVVLHKRPCVTTRCGLGYHMRCT
jgi:hypothetical protein